MKTSPFFKILPCLIALLDISSASPIPDFPFIAVDGRAKREVPPTNAVVSFTVLGFAKTSEEATSTVETALVKVLAALKALGVRDDQIRAYDLEKEAVRNRQEYRELEITGYNVSRSVELRLPDLTNYPKVARTLMAAENITKVDSTFDTSKRDDVEAELNAEACANAKKKAELLAKGAGVAIGSVYAVGDNRGFSNLDGRLGLVSSSIDSMPFGGADPNKEIPLFVPSKIELNAYVSILYKLAP